MIQGHFHRLSTLGAAILVCLAWPTPGHATLYVIILERRGIAIASDSKRITLEGKKIKTSDGVEKLVALGADTAFLSSGLTEISTAGSQIRPAQITESCYTDLSKGAQRVSIMELSNAYATKTTEQLNRLSDSEKAAVDSLLRQFESRSNQVMESIIAGIDLGGTPKVETIDFYLSKPFPVYPDVVRFGWNLNEAIATEAPRVILSGEVGVLRQAFEDGGSPISRLPSVQSWLAAMHEGRQIDAAQTAEALLNLAIEYAPPNQTRLGYPIFVYTLNRKSGLRKIKTVPKGKAADLPH